MPPLSKEKAKMLQGVYRATKKFDEAKDARNAKILEALQTCSVRDVSYACGLSPARVHQIRHGK